VGLSPKDVWEEFHRVVGKLLPEGSVLKGTGDERESV
jgi:hypothetical protein